VDPGLVSVAQAAPPTCRLVVDAADDVGPINPGPQPIPAPAMDIVSADIAADRKLVTTVVRVRKLAATNPSYSPGGIEWSFEFQVGSAMLRFRAHADPAGKISYAATYRASGVYYRYESGLTGVFDTRRNEVRITAPVSLLASQAKIKPGTKLVGLSAATARLVVVPSPNPPGYLLETSGGTDSANSERTYVVGARSCVTPGR